MTRGKAPSVRIVPFTEAHAGAVRDLFVTVNRALAPPDRREAFEAYIARSIAEEIGRIADYYRERHGCFRLAVEDDRLRGMCGLETTGPGRMELRRMYVAPDFQRRGLARHMLADAETVCRVAGNRPRTLDVGAAATSPGALSKRRVRP